MADLDHKSRKLAKRIALRVAMAGESARGEVAPVLRHFVGHRPLSERRAFLKVFMRFLERELRARRLLVEHAGPLSEADLAAIGASFGVRTEGFSLEHRENPGLIGGLRVIHGDNVYDASVAGRLSRLSALTR
jgi:F-type H+-transporting ATPase subunit delta